MPAPSPAKLYAAFWGRVEKTATCWIWRGARTTGGYGTVGRKCRRIRAHRMSYEEFKGPIPVGLEIDHLCGNRACVNPDHLEAVTHRENILRSHPGAFHAAKTHCPYGHEYTPANTYLYKNKRNCRVCARARIALWERTHKRKR